mgnify:CR=1 FL=1
MNNMKKYNEFKSIKENASNEVLELIEMIETIHSQSKDGSLDENWIGWKIILPKVQEIKSNN